MPTAKVEPRQRLCPTVTSGWDSGLGGVKGSGSDAHAGCWQPKGLCGPWLYGA